MSDENSFPPRQGSASNGGPATSPPSGKPVTAVRAGTRIIGTYEIEQLISKGGMGEVYRGRNIHNGEAVAIKIVLPHLAQDEMIAQLFQKEAKILNRLVHDAIVRYYVFTSDPEIGRPCMVMEFVEGTSMNDRMKQGPMPEDEVRILLRRVASGLEKAHQVGIVHRDLSPDNVILEGGTVENAKIIDFGIAKSTMKGDATLLQGQFAGKFSFVAPEQLGAYGGNVDGRTDIYSLALMMVAACQGKVLNMGKSIVEAVRCRGAVPDLSGVYPDLRPLLSHMLEPDPAHRPDSMGSVIKLLDNPDLIPNPDDHVDDLDPDRTVIVSSLPAMESAGPRENTGRGSLPGKTGRGTQPPGKQAEVFVGIPGGAKPAPAAPEKTGGKGGMVMALVALLAVGGGAGAYFGGFLGGAEPPAPATPATPTQTATATPATPPAGTTTPAAEPATPTGTQAAATPAEPATPPAEPAAPATTAGASDTTTPPATAPATTPPATDTASNTTTQPPATDTGTQAAATPPAPTPPAPAPEPTDPLDRQAAWVRDYNGGDCVHVALTGRGDTAVELEGFGKSVDPFAALVNDFRTAHGMEPSLETRVVNDPQCPIVNFMNTLRANQGIPPNLILDNQTDVLKSGETVSGRIEGLAGRAVSLFLVNGAGGATNLKPFLSRASDGSTGFSFTVNLAAGAEPTPQLLLAVVTGQEVTRLDVVPNGVTARALVPFVTSQLTESRQDALGVLRYFRLEN